MEKKRDLSDSDRRAGLSILENVNLVCGIFPTQPSLGFTEKTGRSLDEKALLMQEVRVELPVFQTSAERQQYKALKQQQPLTKDAGGDVKV